MPEDRTDDAEAPSVRVTKGLLAARETTAAAPAAAEPDEVEVPTLASPAEARHAEAAARIAQLCAREWDVVSPELDWDRLAPISEQTRGVAEAKVATEFRGALAHLFSGDPTFGVGSRQERTGLQLADVERRRSDVLDDRPSRGDELGGEGEGGELVPIATNDCLGDRLPQDFLSDDLAKVVVVAALLPNLV